MAPPQTDRGLDRLVNFSDATVAIAITLLILPLVDVAEDLRRLSVREFADVHLGLLIAFAVSFYVIGQFWLLHHRFFESVRAYSRAVLVLDLVWLAGIVFVPFVANAVSAVAAERADVNVLYIATLVVVAGSQTAIEVLYLRRPEMLRDADELDLLSSVTPVSVLVLAGVLAWVVPGPGLLWLLLLIPGGLLEDRLRRHRGGPR